MPKAKVKSVYVCDDCGNESPRWEGRCPSCGQWNTLAEVRRDGPQARSGAWIRAAGEPAIELAQVSTQDLPRLTLSSAEVNRVLGGGIVPGSLTLIAGEPGIGKSTLLLGMAADVSSAGGRTLYVSGEESAPQVKLRADRLAFPGNDLYLLTATELGEVLGGLDKHRPAMAVVDSIQTVYDGALSAEPGSVAQIRACTRQLMEWVKAHHVPVVLSGHVTKGGDVAGPRVMEHMVDAVLYMEGDSVSSWRLLRTIKNRFGSTNEVGVFEMTERGLADVPDPSQALLSERRSGAVGSVIVSTLEGSRPLLAEVQALTSPSVLPTPRRVATGIDFHRLLLVCAVLSRRGGMSLANQDVVVNVAGGLKVGEPAADLGMALALASSLQNAPMDSDTAAIGEVGLSGEIRRVPQLDRRIREVARLGLKRCVVPGKPGEGLTDHEDLDIVSVQSLGEAIDATISHRSYPTANSTQHVRR